MPRTHYRYCPKCCYFNDTCNCEDRPHNHLGIAHEPNCEQPTNAWPKMLTALIDAEACLERLPDVEGAYRATVLGEVRAAINLEVQS